MAGPFPSIGYDAGVRRGERNGPISIVILGVDFGKNSCSIVGVDAAGAVVVRRSMRQPTIGDG
jgi:hypothetical protein